MKRIVVTLSDLFIFDNKTVNKEFCKEDSQKKGGIYILYHNSLGNIFPYVPFDIGEHSNLYMKLNELLVLHCNKDGNLTHKECYFRYFIHEDSGERRKIKNYMNERYIKSSEPISMEITSEVIDGNLIIELN